MPEGVLIANSAPTLAGIKTGSLVNVACNGESWDEVKDDIRRLNRTLRDKGVRVIPFHWSGKNVLLYIYRPEQLQADIDRPEVQRILRDKGYECSNADRTVVSLAQKVHGRKSSADFPHEIGLFLGYPVEDVVAFMTHKDVGCNYIGCWRSYTDAEAARRTTNKFKQCSRIYGEEWAKGRTIDQLTVRVNKCGA